MKRILVSVLIAVCFKPAAAQQKIYRALSFEAYDSTKTGTPAIGYTATGNYKTGIYKPMGLISTGAAITFDLRSIAGNFVEYMRMLSPVGNSSGPFAFISLPTLNPDSSYNNVVSWGVNPFRLADPSKPGVYFVIEPHYIDGGLLTHEIHMPEVQLADGTILRLASATFRNRGTAAASDNTWHFRGENIEFATLLNQSYVSLSGSRLANTSNLSLSTPNTGQGAILGASTTGVSLGPHGLSGDNSQLYTTAFEKVSVPGMQFSKPDLSVLTTYDIIFTAPGKIIYGPDYVTGSHGNFKKGTFTEQTGFSLHAWPGTATLSAIAKDSNPSGLLFQLQKDDFDVNIVKVTNDGKISFLVSEYADNATAIAAGLSAGTIYRTGDNLKIVH